ncbi:MAG TPA: PCRF domain-containing protein [Candidatus Paceibacterota bacterium]
MPQEKEKIEARIAEIEVAMCAPDFWQNKDAAQAMIRELADLKLALEGQGRYDKGSAIINIFAGVGGDDAEDFARMISEMYQKFASRRGYSWQEIDRTDGEGSGGIRSLTAEIKGKDAYGELKHESGVHRLVRLSPFGAKEIRQTSFAMAEVLPDLSGEREAVLAPEEVDISFTRSGGPGGQNVNKRETAVYATHKPTGLTARASSERSQHANRDLALAVLAAKVALRREEEAKAKAAGLSVSKTTEVSWGNQIRSYVLHPYKLVKDHRTGVEVRNPEKVLAGELDEFIAASKEGREAGQTGDEAKK